MREAFTSNGLHVRIRDGEGGPLICLPPAPHSSLYFDPLFDAETQYAYAAKLPPDALPLPIEADFDKAVLNRPGGQSEDRAFRLWVEKLRAGKRVNDAFRAAFAFDCEVRFAALSSSVDVLATQSALLTPSRRAAETLPHATFTEVASVSAPVFDAHASRMAQAILTIIKPKGGPRHKVAP